MTGLRTEVELPADVRRRERDGMLFLVTDCRECKIELLSELGEELPSQLGLQVGRVARRTCDPCIEKLERAQEASKARETVAELVRRSQLPGELRELSFGEMERSGRRGMAVSAAIGWSEGELEKPGLLLMGAAGVGKTRLAGTAAWDRLQRGKAIRWVSVAKLMSRLTGPWTDKQRADALEVIAGLDAVVLDDFDKVNPSEFGRQQLFTAIDERVQAKVPMIVTANLSVVELGERFGDPIMSRLAGHCVQLVMDGPDFRMRLDTEVGE